MCAKIGDSKRETICYSTKSNNIFCKYTLTLTEKLKFRSVGKPKYIMNTNLTTNFIAPFLVYR
jgi:hypothetical protein